MSADAGFLECVCAHTTQSLSDIYIAQFALRRLAAATAELGDIDVSSPWPEDAWELPLFVTGELKTPDKEAVVRSWNTLCLSPCPLFVWA